MTRDAEMRASDWVDLVLRGIGIETDLFAVRSLVARTGQAVAEYTAPEHRAGVADRWEAGLLALVRNAEASSDLQLAFVRGLAQAAHNDEALTLLAGLLDGSATLDGLKVDTDLRWQLLAGLAREGRVDDVAVDEELDRDKTISGQEHAASARAAMPTAEAKAHAWREAVENENVPNETMRSIALSFNQPGQDDVLREYLPKYLATAETIWEERGVYVASTILGYLFPTTMASRETLQQTDAWLETTTANPAARRLVSEGRDDVARALAAQAKRRRELTGHPDRDHGDAEGSRRVRSTCRTTLLGYAGWATGCWCGGGGRLGQRGELLEAGQEAAGEVAGRERGLHGDRGQRGLTVARDSGARLRP